MAEVSSASRKRPLPSKWEVKMSTSKPGRSYYYNKTSGKSTWIVPANPVNSKKRKKSRTESSTLSPQPLRPLQSSTPQSSKKLRQSGHARNTDHLSQAEKDIVVDFRIRTSPTGSRITSLPSPSLESLDDSIKECRKKTCVKKKKKRKLQQSKQRKKQGIASPDKNDSVVKMSPFIGNSTRSKYLSRPQETPSSRPSDNSIIVVSPLSGTMGNARNLCTTQTGGRKMYPQSPRNYGPNEDSVILVSPPSGNRGSAGRVCTTQMTDGSQRLYSPSSTYRPNDDSVVLVSPLSGDLGSARPVRTTQTRGSGQTMYSPSSTCRSNDDSVILVSSQPADQDDVIPICSVRVTGGGLGPRHGGSESSKVSSKLTRQVLRAKRKMKSRLEENQQQLGDAESEAKDQGQQDESVIIIEPNGSVSSERVSNPGELVHGATQAKDKRVRGCPQRGPVKEPPGPLKAFTNDKRWATSPVVCDSDNSAALYSSQSVRTNKGVLRKGRAKSQLVRSNKTISSNNQQSSMGLQSTASPSPQTSCPSLQTSHAFSSLSHCKLRSSARSRMSIPQSADSSVTGCAGVLAPRPVSPAELIQGNPNSSPSEKKTESSVQSCNVPEKRDQSQDTSDKVVEQQNHVAISEQRSQGIPITTGPKGSVCVIEHEMDAESDSDVEFMDVDEVGPIMLSNLQDARFQTATMPQKVTGTLMETVIRTGTPIVIKIEDSPEKHKGLILVVDTNVFISCLLFLEQIYNSELPGYGSPILVVPWVVMHELDYIKDGQKNRRYNEETCMRARQAVRFIQAKLSEKSPRLIGQTPMEDEEKTELRIQCNDDRILQCCLQYSRKCPKDDLVLLTRDMNLNNMATIMSIMAANPETLWSKLNMPRVNLSQVQKPTLSTSDPSSNPAASNQPIIHSTVRQNLFKWDQGTNKSNPPVIVNTTSETHRLHQEGPMNRGMSSSHLATNHGKIDVVLNKFQAVWNFIFQQQTRLQNLRQNRHCLSLREVDICLQRMLPLMSALKQNFSRCLDLSPIILESRSEDFKALSTSLNIFISNVQMSNCDNSRPVDVPMLISHFKDGKNRSLLMMGLRQLSEFIVSFEAMRQRIRM